MRIGWWATLSVAAMLAACSAPDALAFGRWAPPDPPGLSLHPTTARALLAEVARADADVVLLNVWATWCLPCREEFPALLRVRREYRSRLAVVFVSGDDPSRGGAVRAMLAELGVDFPTYIKTEKDMAFIEAIHPEWSGAMPATFLYGRRGRLLDWWEGSASYDELAAAVESALRRQEDQEEVR